MANVLITGGTGFAGSHLVELLLQTTPAAELHVTTSSNRQGFVHDLLPASSIHQVDLTNQAQVTALIQEIKPQHIYHLAASAAVGSSFELAQEVLTTNLRLQLNILEAVKIASASSRLLIVGSGMEYDCIQAPSNSPLAEDHPLGPVSPYAVSKVVQDLLGLSYHYSYQLDIVRARPFNHIGERQTPDFAIPSFAKQIVAIERGQQPSIQVGNLDAVRDFTDVKDVVAAYALLMKSGQAGAVYNIGSGQGQKMSDILTMMAEMADQPIKIETDPTKFRPLDVPSIVADITKIKSLGWQPSIDLASSLSRVLAYWRQQPLS